MWGKEEIGHQEIALLVRKAQMPRNISKNSISITVW